MKKYEFTGETKELLGITLRRIRAIKSFVDVKAGDIGGWIEKDSNISHDGNAWVSGDAWVYGNAVVSGNAWVSGDARVYGNAWVYSDAVVSGDARVSGDAWVSGDAVVSGDAMVYGNAWVSGGKWNVSPCYIQGTRWSVNISSPETVRCGCQDHTWQEWHDRYKSISRVHGADDVLEEYIRYFNLLCVMYGHEDCRIGVEER